MEITIRIDLRIHVHNHHEDSQPAKVADGITFGQAAEKAVAEAMAAKRHKTVENYKTAIRSFSTFLNADPPLSQLSATTIEGYAKWLRDRGLCMNTQSCYLRSLRAILGSQQAASRETVQQMFRQVYTGNAKTEKRAVNETVIRQLQQLSLPRQSPLSLTRDIFLFSFYAQGMPFVDIAHLKKSQLVDDTIVYDRHKTGQRISVRVEPCMADIIRRRMPPTGDYLFPIIHHVPPAMSDLEYRHQLNRYNRTLKLLATKAGIADNLTSYVARHTWASVAFKSNVDLPVISKALGHTNPQTTLVYVKEINDTRLADANRQLLEAFRS